ncbi:sensor histidine kinase [Micromonospora endophytica]|uniref:Two-component sensor histidine kinase n=1 Tax=Micromonospora endophytica TaxID=515350 RepID=A0A2W2CVD3_9ACTN|nr:histidine kinase [Micromonospora endophytica]PZF97254.1 two-component sensor histidine kinase [Micromonospora endophytica]RIW51438.1 two-component sensor histidine kinase [Micromonospora endophytica]
MRRVGTDEWSGLAMLVVAVGVAVPGLFGAIELVLPRGWWVALFVLFLSALLTSVAAPSGWSRRVAFGTAVVASWVLVLSAQQLGLLPVLLVLTASVSVYVVPLGAGLALVGLNTAVIIFIATSATRAPVELTLTVGFYLLIQVASLLSSVTLLREQRRRRELAVAHVGLQAAGLRLEESARTEERLRISRELHDLIGHQLTVLTLELETARHLDGAAAQRHVERADRVARELLGDVRSTVGQLRTETPDLEEALRRMARDLPGLDVMIEVAPGVRVDEERAAALVRAAQEIITNTIRHAEARHLWITVTGDDTGTVLEARDDGCGARNPVFGNGLRGLRERFRALGGEVAVDGETGFRVTARVPAS